MLVQRNDAKKLHKNKTKRNTTQHKNKNYTKKTPVATAAVYSFSAAVLVSPLHAGRAQQQ